MQRILLLVMLAVPLGSAVDSEPRAQQMAPTPLPADIVRRRHTSRRHHAER